MTNNLASLEIPPWVVFALLSPFFWSFVYVLDAYCIGELFERSWIGIVTSALMMLLLLPALLCGLVFVPVVSLSVEAIAWCGAAGVIFILGQALYFQALVYSESGIVAAYFNLLPIILLAIGFFVLGETLSWGKYLGSFVLVGSSVLFSQIDANRTHRWISLGLMSGSACLQAVYFLIIERLLKETPSYQAFVLITVAMIPAGLFPLLFVRCRRVIGHNWQRIRLAMKFLLGIEAVNLLAVGTNQQALGHGHPALVAAVEATAPAFVFLLSSSLFLVFRKYGEQQALQRLPFKLGLVVAMSFGVWLVS